MYTVLRIRILKFGFCSLDGKMSNSMNNLAEMLERSDWQRNAATILRLRQRSPPPYCSSKVNNENKCRLSYHGSQEIVLHEEGVGVPVAARHQHHDQEVRQVHYGRLTSTVYQGRKKIWFLD